MEEPSSDLTKLADLQGIASSKVKTFFSSYFHFKLILLLPKVKYLALAQENVPLAMELLETAFIRGQWLIFQVRPSNDTDSIQNSRMWIWCQTSSRSWISESRKKTPKTFTRISEFG